MSTVEAVLGRVVAELALAGVMAEGTARRPALRVAGFNEPEVLAIATELVAAASRLGRPLTVKVGTRRQISGLPPNCLLGPSETMTYWRNRGVAALVLIDLDPQGDEQGLQALPRLDDHNILTDDPQESTQRLDQLVRAAWAITSHRDVVPGRLLDDLRNLQIWLGGGRPRSLRRWTSFVARACHILELVPLLRPDDVDLAIGQSLPELGLFPDRQLFIDERGVRTRLLRNSQVADLRQPSGSPITEDDLLSRIGQCDFDGELLERFDINNAETLRDSMRRVVQGGGDPERSAVELSLWLELFERRTEQLGLGQLVNQNIAAVAPERLSEFLELEVESGLDSSEQEAAERLLRAEPPSLSVPLIDVIDRPLRRRVEKLAFPDAQLTADPLRAILHGIHVLTDVEGSTVRLEYEGQEPPAWSLWLFSFLYGRTLSDVIAGDSGGGRQLDVAAELLGSSRPELPEEEDELDQRAWAPLRLILQVNGGAARRFRWDPQHQTGLIAFAALALTGGRPAAEDGGTTLERLCDRYLDPRNWHVAAHEPSGMEIIDQLEEARVAFARAVQDGLTADAMDEYVERWAQLADQARQDLVPRNAPLPELQRFVLTDVVPTTEGRLAMLATHPLRLRWLLRHFRSMTRLLTSSLANGLRLNAENPELFFEWLDRASPHGTPPIIVGADETVAVAIREYGWHEEYASVRTQGQDERDWLAAIDDASIEEMVAVIVSYLDTYPHKQDGLTLLILVRDGEARVPLRIVQRLRSRVPNVRVELNVFAPARAHHDVVRAFEEGLSVDDGGGERLLPDVQLILYAWDPETSPNLATHADNVDVALAPALFGTRTSLNRQTRVNAAGLSGSYDPWLHQATHDLSESSENVVRVMLPQQADPILETWSTLCVRHDAHSAVAPDQEGNVDFFTLQVRFDRHQRLFAELHAVAHWVVTLDAFIGRDQVDRLQDRPDVILVKTGVGKNESYTLLVSSATGRRFVVRGLTQKLRHDLGFGDEPDPGLVAKRIYDIGRHVVPGAILRALGLGRASNEVVGLVASRFEAARTYPVDDRLPGLEVWISFDEHQDWFGRTQRLRADIGRFVLRLDDEANLLRVDILVVESKFRQIFDVGAAEQQVDRTTELCRLAFGSDGETADDAKFWRLELAAAIEQTSALAVQPSDLPARRVVGPTRVGLDDAVLQSLRSGQLSLDSVRGVVVAIAARSTEDAPPLARLQAHDLIRINRNEFAEIIQRLLDNTDPSASPPRRPLAPDLVAPGPPAAEPTPPAQDESSDPVTTPLVAATEPGPERDAGASTSVSERGLGQAGLRDRYERTLDALRQHNVAVDPPPTGAWLEGPGFYILRVVPRAGVTVDRVVNRVNEISLALRLEAGAKIRTSLDRGSVVFEIPKASGERYAVSAADLWALAPVSQGGLAVPLGADVAGDVVSLDFSSPDSPHLLVAGTTGSGKSVALETLLRGLCRYSDAELRLHLVDPKGTELVEFEQDPHTDGAIGMDAADALEMLGNGVVEMQRRYDLLRQVRARSLVEYNASVASGDRLPWRVILLDEYADLTSDADDKTRIEAALRRLTQKARAAGIHVVVATQRPSADVVSTTIRSNFPAQLALRVKTAVDSRIIMDEPGAEALAGQGDAFLRTARGLTRLQVAYSG